MYQPAVARRSLSQLTSRAPIRNNWMASPSPIGSRAFGVPATASTRARTLRHFTLFGTLRTLRNFRHQSRFRWTLGVDKQVQAASELVHLFGIGRSHKMMRAELSRFSGFILVVEIAVTSVPIARANWIARWPRPPMPSIPTRLAGRRYLRKGL